MADQALQKRGKVPVEDESIVERASEEDETLVRICLLIVLKYIFTWEHLSFS